MKRSSIALVALLIAAPVLGNEVNMQSDETFPWACTVPGVTLTSLVGVTVTKLAGPTTDANPDALVTGEQVSGGRIVWTFTPTGKSGTKAMGPNVYQVHAVAEDAADSRFACDGRVNVLDVVLDF